MSGIKWSELFPTKLSIIIFIAYLLLFINQGILVTASQGSKNDYNYNVVTVVLLTEVLKLVISCTLYCREGNLKGLCRDVFNNTKILALYLIPAFLYCLYNNLSFKNLATFDPTTYYLLLQFRVVITGILFQLIFKKCLTTIQWFSLILLTAGCMLKQVDFGVKSEVTNTIAAQKNMRGFDLSIDAVFILIQMLCSCFAGVYNEHLLKREGADVNIYVQNVFMYLDSIICNLSVLILNGDILSAFTQQNLEVVFHYKVILIMINNACAGIVTSFFLKSLNSIVKTFAAAVELILMAITSYLVFGIPIHLNTVLAIFVSGYAIYLYSRNPVNNNQDTEKKVTEDKEQLLKETV